MNEPASTMDDERMLARLAQEQVDGLRLIVAMGPYDVWLTVAGLQLATRHPALPGHLRRDFETIGRRIARSLGPGPQRALDAGWDPSQDQPPASFRCPACGRVSYHPDDIANRYCGACHAYMS